MTDKISSSMVLGLLRSNGEMARLRALRKKDWKTTVVAMIGKLHSQSDFHSPSTTVGVDTAAKIGLELR